MKIYVRTLFARAHLNRDGVDVVAVTAGATLLMVLMEEKPLAGPASVPAEMAE